LGRPSFIRERFLRTSGRTFCWYALTCPTLWEKFLPKRPNVSFRLLKHSGHTPQLEQPDTFGDVLLRWIQQEE